MLYVSREVSNTFVYAVSPECDVTLDCVTDYSYNAITLLLIKSSRTLSISQVEVQLIVLGGVSSRVPRVQSCLSGNNIESVGGQRAARLFINFTLFSMSVLFTARSFSSFAGVQPNGTRGKQRARRKIKKQRRQKPKNCPSLRCACRLAV